MKKRVYWPILILIFAGVLLLGSAQPSVAGDDVWTTQGPYGLRFSSLIVDPENPNTLYAYTFDCEGITTPVFKSEDSGITWFPSGNELPVPQCGNARWHVMVMDPEDSQVLYLAERDGIYKTSDGAQTWNRLTPMVTTSIAISPHGVLYAGVRNLEGFQGGIYRSDDRGETWVYSSTNLPSDVDVVHALVVAPNAQHIIYTAIASAGLYKSIDGGATWQPINNGFFQTPFVRLMAVDPYNSQVVYFSAAFGLVLFRSDNGGESWQPIGEGLPSEPFGFAIDPGNQQVLYAGTWGGFYRSLDNLGESWVAMNEGMGSRAVYSLAIDHQDPQNMYAATQAGIWKRTLVMDEPPDYSISINGGALYTNQTSVTLNFTSPSGVAQIMVSNDGGFAGAAWEPYVASKPWEITTYGQYVLPRIVYCKFRSGGIISGLYQDDIIYDPNAPNGTLSITGMLPEVGQDTTPSRVLQTNLLTNTIYLPLTLSNFRYGYQHVHLRLTAEDDLSGVDAMKISQNADLSGAEWEPYLAEKDWWLATADGPTIYVVFRDRAGNVSAVIQDIYEP
ncbi:MAG: hypothetical protein JW726_04130 [Anaerolineales bacterium]|nr:hypothetical protein [Anaerolineales bacterium]